VTAPRRPSPLLALLTAALLALPPAASGYWYKCTKDDHTYNGEEPPPECKDVPIKEMNPNGTLNRIIDPPETREQKANREAEEKARRDREKETEAQRRNDRRLLQTYETTEDIEAARDRALAEPGRRIALAKKRLKELDAEQKHLDEGEKPFYTNHPMPDWLKQAFKDIDDQRAQQHKSIDEANADIQRINERFDADAKRFRELEAGATR
jgi:hypothetical protein